MRVFQWDLSRLCVKLFNEVEIFGESIMGCDCFDFTPYPVTRTTFLMPMLCVSPITLNGFPLVSWRIGISHVVSQDTVHDL